MNISKDIFLAILSMDAYNREYGAGINLGVNTAVGDAAIKDRQLLGIGPVEYAAWQAAGFYAVAYTVGAGVDGLAPGTTVISYRGTDTAPATDMDADMAEGWPLGAGNFLHEQTRLATGFLDAVQNDSAPASVILTGPSLGGGLAEIAPPMTSCQTGGNRQAWG